MKTKLAVEDDKDAAAALLSKAEDDSDVDEDHQVADLSTIPTPVIGFKMPKLNREDERKEGKKTLSANLLNNTIVNMRAIVEKAKFFEETQCKRKIKRLKTDTKAPESMENKVERLQEDINGFKSANNDDVAKFAILNKKPRGDLLSKKDITPSERCLCLLATSKTVLKAVEKYRNTYDDWETRTAYFLQRLGQQYQVDDKKNEKKDKKKRKNTASSKESSAEDVILPETSQAVVKKIKLSKGGIIDVKKSAPASEKPEKPANEEEEDEEEAGFFLNSSGTAPKVVKKPIFVKEKRAPKPKEEETLHPSWAAKLKKKKEMENIKPQGKKVVFDED